MAKTNLMSSWVQVSDWIILRISIILCIIVDKGREEKVKRFLGGDLPNFLEVS